MQRARDRAIRRENLAALGRGENPWLAGSPPRPATFPEGAPTGIRMENLHPEDQAELAAANDAVERANDLQRGYEAAAQCLTYGGIVVAGPVKRNAPQKWGKTGEWTHA
jgi:hypothetical protein